LGVNKEDERREKRRERERETKAWMDGLCVAEERTVRIKFVDGFLKDVS